MILSVNSIVLISVFRNTGELGYDGPLYDRFLHMTDNMLGPSPIVFEGECCPVMLNFFHH